MSKKGDTQFKLRLPIELKSWLDRQAELNRSSKGSEVVRCIRERKERMDGGGEQGGAAA